MNDYKNFCEYVAAAELTSKKLLARVLLMIFYTVFVAVYTFAFWLILGLWELMILLPFIVFSMIKLTWKYTVVEYEYSIEAGELRVAAIYNKSSRWVKLRVSLSEMTLIAPFDKRSREMLGKGDIDEVKDFSASKWSESAYLCIYHDKKRSKKRAVIIETTTEAQRILKLCNPSAFTSSQR